MFARLVPLTTATAASVNARLYDIVKLITGAYTQASQLNSSVWEARLNYVKTDVYPANWTMVYSSIALESLPTSTSTSWSMVFKKNSVSYPTGKTVSWKLERTATLLNIYVGDFNNDGTAIRSAAAVAATGGTTLADFYTEGKAVYVSTAESSFFLGLQNTESSALVVEKSTAPYDRYSLESLALLLTTKAGTPAYTVCNIYNPKLGNYTAFAVTGASQLTPSYGITRDNDGNECFVLTPLWCSGYANGWAYTNCSEKSQVFYSPIQLADMDGFTYNGKPCRAVLFPTNNIHFLLIDG